MSPSAAKDETRSIWMKSRVTATEYDCCKDKAAKAGLSLSEYIRRQILDGLIIQKESAVDEAAVYALKALGNNMNQITRKAHINGSHDSERLNEVLDTLSTVLETLIDDS